MKRSNKYLSRLLCLAGIILLTQQIAAQQPAKPFQWPNGKKMAISLSFDDARESQVLAGTPVLDAFGVKATFFVVPSTVEKQLEGWKKAVAKGHEIGNHSLTHPCSGNFAWSRDNALENYSLAQMRSNLTACNQRLEELLHIKPVVFAYPCGQKYVGSGTDTKSYVPLVAEMFLLGRGWQDEAPNDPRFCNFAQLTGIEMDGKEFDEILEMINSAKENGQWLVLAGHEIGESGNQTTRLSMLKKLLAYSQDPANGIWIAPMGTVASYLKNRK